MKQRAGSTSRRARTVFSALLAVVALAQPALAETVVLECKITSGDVRAALFEKRPGVPILLKIGDEEWREWRQDQGEWSYNKCKHLGYAIDGDDNSVMCDFSREEFKVKGITPSYFVEISINRETGSLETRTMTSELDHSATGTCTRGVEPSLPPASLPPTKF